MELFNRIFVSPPRRDMQALRSLLYINYGGFSSAMKNTGFINTRRIFKTEEVINLPL
jgi:hypothetical protein